VNVVPLKKPDTTSVTLTIELPDETAALVNKFVALNQTSRNTHCPMDWTKLCQLWLEGVAAATKDNTTWQRAHAALALSEHGYRT
jgi:hypothetical protein